MPELVHTVTIKKRLICSIYITLLKTVTTDLGVFIRVSMFEHVDRGLGPLLRSPRMGEGGDW